jgi:hypothetical protein
VWFLVAVVAAAGIGGGLMLGRRGHVKRPAEEPAGALATEGAAQYRSDH